MATIDDQIHTQIANIERRTGRSLADWFSIVRASGLQKHGQVVAMLKAEHGMGHGNANLIALRAREADAGGAVNGEDLIAAHYAGKNAPLRPAYEAVVERVRAFGDDVELAPKKTYVSLRRRKQFGQVRPPRARSRSVSICRTRCRPSGSRPPRTWPRTVSEFSTHRAWTMN